jgi:transcriptional regulator with XRE-family HTH domain
MDEEVGRRIRAARAYADIKQPDLARELGVSRDTLYRLEKGGRQLRPLEDEGALLARIAEICGLPDVFFTGNFHSMLSPRAEPLADQDSVEANFMEALRGLLSDVEWLKGEADPDLARRWREREAARAAARQPADGGVPQPGGELGRRVEEPQTTDERQQQPETPPAAAREPSSDG